MYIHNILLYTHTYPAFCSRSVPLTRSGRHLRVDNSHDRSKRLRSQRQTRRCAAPPAAHRAPPRARTRRIQNLPDRICQHMSAYVSVRQHT